MINKHTFLNVILGLFFLITSKSLSAQEYFSLNVDNDLYFTLDRYYSSGIFLQYGKQLKSKHTISENTSKNYLLWELGQELYTPNDRYTTDVSLLDYPYGGWTSVKATYQKEYSSLRQVQWGVQLGVTGSISGAQWMQNTYHRTVLNLPELTWVAEVPQAFHVNLFLDSFNRWNLRESVSVQSHVFSVLGTQKIAAGGALGLVLGSQTVPTYGGNVLLDNRQGDGLYVGGRVQFVVHDYMLSGSLFNSEAPFTVPVNRIRATVEIGYALRRNKWRYSLMYYNRSPDNKNQIQKGHHYLNITISRFFSS